MKKSRSLKVDFFIVAAVAAYLWVQWSLVSAQAALLEAEAVTGFGVVVDMTQSSGGGRKSPRSFQGDFEITIEFRDSANVLRRERASISEKFFGRLRIGMTVGLRYARSDPKVIEVELGQLAGVAKLYLAFAAIVTAVLAMVVAMVAVYRSLMAQASSR